VRQPAEKEFAGRKRNCGIGLKFIGCAFEVMVIYIHTYTYIYVYGYICVQAVEHVQLYTKST